MRLRLGVLGLLVALCANAYGASPALTVITPRGAQRGTEVTFRFTGARLHDAEEILFYEPGIEVIEITNVKNKDKVDANRVDVKALILPDCPLGEHAAQVRTRSGVSELRLFFIGDMPNVAEVEPNNDFETAQTLENNVTVEGIVKAEDRDLFVIEAKADERISVETEAIRLAGSMIDTHITVFGPDGRELNSNDDFNLLRQDSALSFIAPADAKYIVQIRDASWRGDNSARYRLHIGSFPRPTAVYPAGGKAGEEIELTFVGDGVGETKQVIPLPATENPNHRVRASDAHGQSPTGHPFRVSAFGNSLEVEPNNSNKEASPAALPNAFNGILNQPGDIDYFKFSAKKGQSLEVECYGRRLRSPIDPVVYVYDAKMKRMGSSDDSRGPDSYFRWKVPADGEYFLRVGEHMNRGGEDFVYRVEMTPTVPTLELGIPRVTRYDQYRQQIFVARGNRFGTLLSAKRANFSGDLVLTGEGLPAGVKMVAKPMPSNMNLMPVVFEAAADAPIEGALVDFRARHADEKQKISGGFKNKADFVRYRPGQSMYAWREVDRVPIVVVDELPFHLEIVQPKAPMVQYGQMGLKVVAKKKEGWDENIDVEFRFKPPGVGASYRVRMPKGKNEISYPLSANKSARVGTWPIYVIGSANVDGSAWVSSQMAHVEIEEPFVDIEMQRVVVPRGESVELTCKINHKREFAGKAKVELLGLPHKVTTTPLEITKDTKEITFPIKTEAASPIGNHKNLFCRVTMTINDEPVVHSRLGYSIIRIDAPRPTTVAKKAAPKKKALSRLEQLRQQTSGGGEE